MLSAVQKTRSEAVLVAHIHTGNCGLSFFVWFETKASANCPTDTCLGPPRCSQPLHRSQLQALVPDRRRTEAFDSTGEHSDYIHLPGCRCISGREVGGGVVVVLCCVDEEDETCVCGLILIHSGC